VIELVICAAMLSGNCQWTVTPQPSLSACEAVIAAILADDRRDKRLPPPVMYCLVRPLQ
jgi:hypothetical protein